DIVQKTILQSNIFDHEKLNNIIKSLRALGAKPEELTSILQLMKSAGCLHAKLEII
ncbi:flagellar basal body P-ring protein FlgI, partial [Buchnera aphidicola]|nr:flagellar basal body P-ring protein FlgI [Buchnera aphidicola]